MAITQEILSDRFKLLNREASLISSLLSSGLTSFRNISKGNGYYYEGFYSISIGLERLLKLVILSKNSTNTVKKFGHKIKELFLEINISFDKSSIEQSIIDFLHDFATKNRYCIPDILNCKGRYKINEEPIASFYNSVLMKILKIHRPRKIVLLPDISSVRAILISENFLVSEDLQDLSVHVQIIAFASKYLVMYIGRILHPVIDELYKIQGLGDDNPYFNDFFRYLYQDDSYFRTRKTFRV